MSVVLFSSRATVIASSIPSAVFHSAVEAQAVAVATQNLAEPHVALL